MIRRIQLWRPTRGGLAGLAVVCFLAFVIAMAAFSFRYQPPPGEDRPKITDWMQAWGTIGGVVAGSLAALILWFEWARAQRENKRRHAEHLTWYLRERRQADTELRTPADAGEHTHDPPPDWVTEAVLVVINSSDSCIYQVTVSIPEFRNYSSVGIQYLAERGLGTVPPGQTAFVMPMRGYRSPGSTAARHVSELPSNRPVEYVQFRDPAGPWWRRSNKGELTEVPNTDPGIRYPDYSW